MKNPQPSLIDFSECEEVFSNLDGAAQKTRIIFEGKNYILKYGDALEPNKNNSLQGSYRHSPIYEWLGSHVFDELDIPVQNTLLGEFNGHEVVACEDFVIPQGPNAALVPFNHLEGNIIPSSKRDRRPHLNTMMEVFNTHKFLAPIKDEAIARYWDTFVVDSIIGNFDRHGGNWGYIASTDPITHMIVGVIGCAPIYDCGSSGTPQLSEDAMPKLMADPDSMRRRVLSFPKACLVVSGKNTIAYQDLYASEYGGPAREALLNFASKIQALDFRQICDEIPGATPVRKTFTGENIICRIKNVVQPALDLACDEVGATRINLLEKRRVLVSVPGKSPSTAAYAKSSRDDGFTEAKRSSEAQKSIGKQANESIQIQGKKPPK